MEELKAKVTRKDEEILQTEYSLEREKRSIKKTTRGQKLKEKMIG